MFDLKWRFITWRCPLSWLWCVDKTLCIHRSVAPRCCTGIWPWRNCHHRNRASARCRLNLRLRVPNMLKKSYQSQKKKKKKHTKNKACNVKEWETSQSHQCRYQGCATQQKSTSGRVNCSSGDPGNFKGWDPEGSKIRRCPEVKLMTAVVQTKMTPVGNAPTKAMHTSEGDP